MRIAINGFGRIGRSVLRAAYERGLCGPSAAGSLEFVAIHEPADPESIAYLTRYDSTHGRFPASVEVADQQLHIADLAAIPLLGSGEQGHSAPSFAEAIDWQGYDVDWVLDCSGVIGSREQAQCHIDRGAKRVLLSNPGEQDIPVIVYGVNQQRLEPLLKGGETVFSAASCTSNALLPALATMHQHFTVTSGVITTIHAAMHDQPVIDAYHGNDLRKNRASSESFIPVSTELAAGIGRVLPDLADVFVAQAIRVPVSNVSALNVTLNLANATSVDEINTVLAAAGAAYPEHVLAVTDEPLASCDFIHQPCSGTIDALQTQLVNERTVNLLIWFDNEWAFANRMLDILLLPEAAV